MAEGECREPDSEQGLMSDFRRITGEELVYERASVDNSKQAYTFTVCVLR